MFFIINKNTRAVIRTSETPFNVDESVQPPAPALQLKRVDSAEPAPAFGAAIENLVQIFTDDDPSGTRTFSWTKAAKTVAEQAAYQQSATDRADLQAVKAVYQDLKNGTGTQLQRTVRLEKAVAYLLRESVRN